MSPLETPPEEAYMELLDFAPRGFDEGHEGVARRDVLKLLGASVAFAAATSACTRQPREVIAPYARIDSEHDVAQPTYYATTMPMNGVGLLVHSNAGHPSKIEGNPEHPSSLGATDVFAQAAVLSLCDPDRATRITHAGVDSTWTDFADKLSVQLTNAVAGGGRGLRVLSESINSPALAAQREAFLSRYPNANWHVWSPIHDDEARAGALTAFGADVAPVYHCDQADIIVSLGGGLLDDTRGHLAYTRQVTRRRTDALSAKIAPQRLYTLESVPTLTGSFSDHRLVVDPATLERLALEIHAGRSDHPFVAALLTDAAEHRGRVIFHVGREQPARLHSLGHALGMAYGTLGTTVHYINQSPRSLDHTQSVAALAAAAQRGEVSALIILGGNPVYDAPVTAAFAAALEKVSWRAHLSECFNETSAHCHWHIPQSHFLECFGDAVAHDGTVGLMQPLIAPLYASKSIHEVAAALLGDSTARSYDVIVKFYETAPPQDFERALESGIARPAAPAQAVALAPGFSVPSAPARANDSGLFDIAFRPDAHIWDGRFANNAWLQELPRPHTRLTWDNAFEISPDDAAAHGLRNGDNIRVEVAAHRIEGPVFVTPGVARRVLVARFGYGRTLAGQFGSKRGYDAYAIRSQSWLAQGTIVKTSGSYKLVTTQAHHRMEGRDLARELSLRDVLKGAPDKAHHNAHAMLYPGYQRGDGPAWGMTIDLNRCIGCNACTIACQAENNIPAVGKDQVAMGREMHWIRVDRYYKGPLRSPRTLHQPVPCMQCENAPCEYVCPVGATVHSHDGLNDMVYNRCVGTRYCSNNCPYKVRRFNYFLYSDWKTENLEMVRNPEVSVRSRGVMEKCTYCVQRIRNAQIQHRIRGEVLVDGAIQTACQQVCPAEAIAFGDLNDPASAVVKLKQQPRNYGLLEELNTRPRTSYLARVYHSNPDIADG